MEPVCRGERPHKKGMAPFEVLELSDSHFPNIEIRRECAAAHVTHVSLYVLHESHYFSYSCCIQGIITTGIL